MPAIPGIIAQKVVRTVRQKLLIALFFSMRLVLAQPDKTAWDVLKLGLTDKNPEKRRQAVTAAGSIGLVPEAIQQVEQALHDIDPVVRQTAAAELADMKSLQSIPALKTEINDSSGEVAFAAAKALWDLGDVSGREGRSYRRTEDLRRANQRRRARCKAKAARSEGVSHDGDEGGVGRFAWPIQYRHRGRRTGFQRRVVGRAIARSNLIGEEMRSRNSSIAGMGLYVRQELGGKGCFGKRSRPMRQCGFDS
jgi:hypothetical protein